MSKRKALLTALQSALLTALPKALLTTLLAALPTALYGQTQLVIVSGLGGDPKYGDHFATLASSLAEAAHERGGVPDSAIAWFGEASATKSRWYRGASTKPNIEQALTRLAAQPATAVAVILIGHGSGEGAQSRISLPGADLTASDFARLLDAFGERPVAFINMASASGDMLPVLAAKTRVVVTATKSAFERNESQFARYFVNAFARDGADTDKDNRVSVLEAFTYADAETKRFYEEQQLMATEHPQIADAGQLARRFFLTAAAAGGTSSDPRMVALYAERQKLEDQVAALRLRKESMSAPAYDAELERLLVALAEKSAEIRRLEGGQ